MASVTIDGSVPANSEAESLGASRIRNLATAVNGLFGQGVTFTYGVNPFTVDALGNVTVNTTIVVPTPTLATQAATKGYVDASSAAAQAIYCLLSNGGSGNAYTGVGSPVPTALHQGILYILQFTQSNPGGPVTVNISGLGATTVKKAAGVDLAVGDIPALGILACFFDGTNFQIASAGGGNAAAFQGIGVTSVAPTNGQVWQYNSGTGLWTPVTLGVAGGYASVNIASQAIHTGGGFATLTTSPGGGLPLTAPASGGPFRILVSYFVGILQGVSGNYSEFQVTDGTNVWANGGTRDSDSATHSVASAHDISPTTYANGATPTLNIQGNGGGAATVGGTNAGSGAQSVLKALFIPIN